MAGVVVGRGRQIRLWVGRAQAKRDRSNPAAVGPNQVELHLQNRLVTMATTLPTPLDLSQWYAVSGT